MSVKKTVLGLGFAIAMLANEAYCQTPQVFLTVVDTVLYPNVGEPYGRMLTVRMNNPVVHIGGFRISLSIGEPSIINFTYTTVDTTPPYLDTIVKCTPCPPCTCRDTIITVCPDTCFVYHSTVETQGTRTANYDYIQARRLDVTVLDVTGDAQSGTGPVMQPGNGVLFRVPLTIFPIADSIPLSQRQVKVSFDSIFTYVADSTGNTIWTADNGTLSLTPGTVTVPFSMKGDLNFDGKFTPVDVSLMLFWVFLGTPLPLPSPSVGDVNCDGQKSPSDVSLELTRVFLFMPFPC